MRPSEVDAAVVFTELLGISLRDPRATIESLKNDVDSALWPIVEAYIGVLPLMQGKLGTTKTVAD